MKNIIIYLFAGMILLATACKKKRSEPETTQPPTTQPPTTGTPGSVETNPPNATYRPAFQGQTRIGAVQTATAVQTRVITSALNSPWGIAALPDGRFLITERAGNMRIVTSTGQVSAPLTGVPAVNSGGQGGLLGICLDPAFATNRMVYWSFSERLADGNVTAIGKGRLSDNSSAIENATVIYRATPAYNGVNHYGGRVVFDRNGNLYASTGERADNATRQMAQSVTAALGKIVRITTDGQPAAGNPSFAQTGARPELFTIGHRNPQGLAIHPVTGDLWQAEHGPRGGDEINHITAGRNYGWPIITYGLEYSGQAVGGALQQNQGMEQPVYYWDPVVSPSGMTFYTGNRVPEWQNNLFIGALSGMHIVRLVIENNRVTGEERLLVSERQRFRDITQGADNALYAITDQGRLYRIDRE